MRLNDLSDEELALRARVEPGAAFEVLFCRYRGPLWSFLVRQGAPNGRAEDLFQMTFFRAFRGLPSFRQEAKFKTWLYTIAVNVLNDDRRAMQRCPRMVELKESTPSDMPTAHESAERAEVVQRVKEALAGIAPDDRQLFTLVRFEDLSVAEAAKIIGVSVSAARMTLHRVGKRIGKALDPVTENQR